MAFGNLTAARADLEFRANTGQARREMGELHAVYARTTGAMSTESIRAAVAQEKLDRAIARHGPESHQARQATLGYRREIEQLAPAVRRAEAGVRSAEGHVNRFGRGVVAGSGAVRGLRGALAYASTGFLGGAGLAFAIKSTLDKAGDFQQTMQVLQEVSGGTGREMQKVSHLAIRLGADVHLPATSAKDAAAAMLELTKAGLTLPQAMAAARGTLQLAAAAQIDEGQAAEIASRQLNAFGLSGDQAGRVADVLAATANAATGEIGDFALGFQQSSAVAHQFGLSIEDTATALAELANKGIVGSDAGTSLRVMLTRLTPTTKKATEEMDRLGISWHDSHGNIRPLRDLIGQYHTALAKLTPAQRAQALQTLFGTDAQRAANIILGGGVQNYDRLRKKVSEHGAASRLSAAQTRGYKGALDAFQSALETTQITIGLALLPQMTKLLRAGTAWLGSARNQRRIQHDVNEALRAGKSVVHGLADALRIVRAIVVPVNHALGGTTNTVKLLAGAFAAFKAAKLLGALNAATSGIRGIGRTAVVATGEVEALAGAEAAAGGGGGVAGRVGKAGRAGRLGRIARSAPFGFTPVALAGLAVDGTAYEIASGVESAQKRYLEAQSHTASDQVQRSLVPRLAAQIKRMKKSGVAGSEIIEKLREQLGGNTDQANELIAQAFRYSTGDHSVIPPKKKKPKPDKRSREPVKLDKDKKPAAITPLRTPKPKPVTFALPFALQLEAAKADATTGEADNLAAARDEKAFIDRLIASGKLKGGELLNAYQALGGVNSTLDEHDQQVAETRRKHDQKIAERRRKQAAEHKQQLDKQRKRELERLTSVPVNLRIEEKTALAHHAGEKKLTAIYKRELDALEQQARTIRRLGLGKKAVLDNMSEQARIEKKIRDLRKKSAANNTSTTDFFAEAVSARAQYGSNIDRRGELLSRQDSRGVLGEIAVLLREGNRDRKKVEAHTGAIRSARPGAIDDARMATAGGYGF